MRRSLMLFVLLAQALLFFSATEQAEAQSVVSEQEVRDFMDAWARASYSNDKAWYERHYAESFVKTERDGTISLKRDVLRDMDAAQFPHPPTFAVEDLRIQTFGQVAVVTFRITVDGKTNVGPYIIRARATTAIVKNEGRLQIVAHHATDIAGAK